MKFFMNLCTTLKTIFKEGPNYMGSSPIFPHVCRRAHGSQAHQRGTSAPGAPAPRWRDSCLAPAKSCFGGRLWPAAFSPPLLLQRGSSSIHSKSILTTVIKRTPPDTVRNLQFIISRLEENRARLARRPCPCLEPVGTRGGAGRSDLLGVPLALLSPLGSACQGRMTAGERR